MLILTLIHGCQQPKSINPNNKYGLTTAFVATFYKRVTMGAHIPSYPNALSYASD